jgi:hypothetical protein
MQELIALLEAADRPDHVRELWDIDNRPQLERLLRELTRLLFNVVASAKGLVDHTRCLMKKWYADTEFIEEYNRQVRLRFAQDLTVGFIHDLRNYALHYRLPPLAARLQFAQRPERQDVIPLQTIALDTKGLLEWGSWHRRARAYLEAAGDRIVLREPIDDYARNVDSFHRWVSERLQEIHGDELARFEDMRQRFKGSVS